jgi:hypothetical protein
MILLRQRLFSVVTVFIVILFVPSMLTEQAFTNGTLFSRAITAETASQSAVMNSTSLVVLVLVNSSIFDGVQASLDHYKVDLRSSGFEDIIVMNWSEPSPIRVRETLLQFYSTNNLAGALLVGDIPYAEYEMTSEWGYERFPIDLYYMDLNGVWTDLDGDGVFDDHLGKVAPEIWVGRIKASNLGENADEISLINSYFEKNHRYRNNSLFAPRRALLYMDDDWVGYAKDDNKSVTLLYDDVTVVTDKATTNAADYKSRLKQGFEWVHVRSHGSSGQQIFEVPGGEANIIPAQEFAEIDPYALFYHVVVCWSALHSEPNYLAGEMVLRTNYGLFAVGPTKIGGMLMLWTFYEALARGKTFGDAFKEWFITWGEGNINLGGHYVGRKWGYGLTLIGDPALRLRWLGEKEIAELQDQEEAIIDSLPLVQDLRQQVADLHEDYSSLHNEYNALKDSYSGQLAEVKNLLYVSLLATAVLLASSVYFMRKNSKSKDASCERKALEE